MAQTPTPFSGQVFTVGDTATPVTIDNFDLKQDSISLSNSANPEILPHFSFKDQYTLESTEAGTKVFTKAGDLIAVVEGATELVPFSGITPDGTIQLVSLENDFFSENIEPTFFEPWYLELDKSDYDNSVQKAIDAGLVETPYEHYLKFGQFEAREDSIFSATSDGNNTVYGSGYENGLVGVQISGGVYTRDVTPITTGVGEVDTLIGAPGEDTFFLGNGSVINDKSQPFYVGQGDQDYALIKNFDSGSSFGQLLSESPNAEFYPNAPADARESLTDRIVLAGKAYDYTFEKVDDNLKISYQGDLIALIEDAPPLDVPFSIPGATYLYTTGNEASFGEVDGFGSAARFYDPFYLAENPDVVQAIASGEYKSAFEHYIKVGQLNPEGEAIFSGTSGDDFIAGFGSNDLIIGTEVTFADGEKEGYRTASMGVGEADSAVGGLGVSTFVIGNDNILDPEKGGEVWYVGKGDEDYLSIEGFDPYKDILFGAGKFEDYSFETIDETDDIFGRQVPYKSLEVSYQGDRVALLKYTDGSLTTPTITELQSLPLGDERPNGLALVAAQNQFLPDSTTDLPGLENFNGDFYLATNPDLADLVGEGKSYATALDYYVAVGQYREDGGGHGFFEGTSGNDTIQGFGFDKDLFGIKIAEIEGTSAPGDKFSITTETLGIGEIDTLVGSTGIDGFYAGIFTSYDFATDRGTSQQLYVGQGDQDYALIKDYDPAKDYIYFSGNPADYQYDLEGDNFKVSTSDGDLVAIVENTPQLILSAGNIFTESDGFIFGIEEGVDATTFPGFDEEAYLGIYPEVAKLIEEGKFASGAEHYAQIGQYEEGGGIHSGTAGNDVVIAWTQNAEVRLSGVDFVTAEPAGFEAGQSYLGITPATYGVGEMDTLILSADTGTVSEALLGFFRAADGSMQRFYVGEGDEDYALVKNFNKNDLDEIFLAGAPEDYTYEDRDGDLRIAYQGDLVGIVEGVKYEELELADEGEGSGAFVLIGKPDVEPTDPSAPSFGTTGDDTLEVVNSNGLIFAGAGNDLIDAIASQGDNRIYGGSGDDTFILGGKDILTGQDGSDRFFAQTGGDNLMTGGAGADQFWIASAEIPESANTVTDFTLGEDVIGLAGLGASFEGLTLTQQGDNTLIAFNNDELSVLNGIQSSSLSASNFAFA
jgi:Ca2+-binding RTX toxin-like protein